MTKQNRKSVLLGGRIFLIAITALLTACGNSANTNGASSTSGVGTATTTTSSTLAISPSVMTLTEGGIYSFGATGGTGSYTYKTSSTLADIGYYTGYYTAPTSWTGTTTVTVTDSAGATSTATVYVTAPSSANPVVSTGSVTGTLANCVGESGGSSNSNNWQVNGSELRSIGDANYSNESPINCTGLTLSSAIPSGATITGVSIGIFLINQSANDDGSQLQTLSLIQSGTTLGTAASFNMYIPGNAAAFPTFTEGGSGNTWGATLTPSTFSDSTFGVSIQTYRATDRLFLGEAGSVMPKVTIYYAQ